MGSIDNVMNVATGLFLEILSGVQLLIRNVKLIFQVNIKLTFGHWAFVINNFNGLKGTLMQI